MPKGIPDILAVKRGRMLAVEVKVHPDRLNSAQVSVIESLHHHGVRVVIARDVEDIQDVARGKTVAPDEPA